ncbi:MAG TPA: DNA cytosine methyltransferase, partial [Nocardioides sp.]|nr:DNA cytosine methyltransferase [Nocardioides sp.]
GRGGGHAGLVAAFLARYYGQGGQWSGCDQPLPTVVSKDRFALVTVELDGEPWVLTDIGMRMLQPRELARASGVDDSYQLIGTKSQQVARIGNMVNPPIARALIEAQLDDRGELRGAA